MNIGIIGTGRMAMARARKLFSMPEVTLKWVCSRSPDRALLCLKELSVADAEKTVHIDAMDDWKRAVERHDTDVVVICTPNTLHFDMAEAAMTQGKHVMSEYPHASASADGRRLIDLSLKKGVIFHVGLTYRYGSLFHTLKEILCSDTGEYNLGKPQSFFYLDSDGGVISRWYNQDALTGGTFISSVYDHIDEAIGLLGKVDSVTAHYQCTRDEKGLILKDCATCLLIFNNNSTAQFLYTRGYPKPALDIERTFVCEKGHIRIVKGEIRILTAQGEKVHLMQKIDALKMEILDCIRAVECGKPQYDTASDAQYALEISEKAQKTAGIYPA